jgi:hypothetical protein
MLETERTIETFQGFGKPVHITEIGLPSTADLTPAQRKRSWNPPPPWHGGPWTETMQADWAEQFYTIAFSKPWIQALTWWDLEEPSYNPSGALMNEDLTPKESYNRLLALIGKWHRMS